MRNALGSWYYNISSEERSAIKDPKKVVHGLSNIWCCAQKGLVTGVKTKSESLFNPRLLIILQ